MDIEDFGNGMEYPGRIYQTRSYGHDTPFMIKSLSFDGVQWPWSKEFGRCISSKNRMDMVRWFSGSSGGVMHKALQRTLGRSAATWQQVVPNSSDSGA